MVEEYSGSGYTTNPVHEIQDYLVNRWGSTPAANILTAIQSTISVLGGSGSALAAYLATFGQNANLPATTDAFVNGLLQSASLPLTPANQSALKGSILNAVRNSLSLENAGFDQSIIANALADPSLQANSSTFFNDVYDRAFTKFLSEFNYVDPTVNGTNPTVTSGISFVNSAFFGASFNDFFFKFATVVSTGTSVNFEDIYEAFLGTDNAAFTSFLANYINSVVYPSSGNGQTFLPNENIGDWMKKVQEAYALSIYGSAAPVTSSVGNSFKKVVILDQVLRLIIKMIGTLQKVAATQSNRLRILTLQQSAYTNLLSQVPVFTEGDGSIFGTAGITSKDEAQKARDQANNYNQTLSETIRSKRTTVQDDAKVLQSNLNQSNDSANDQASTATSLLQTMSTLLGAIFR